MLTSNSSLDEIIREAEYTLEGEYPPVCDKLLELVKAYDGLPGELYTQEELDEALGELEDQIEDLENREKEWSNLVWDALLKLSAMSDMIPITEDLEELKKRYDRLTESC